MFFSSPRLVQFALLVGLLLVGQRSVSQLSVRHKTPTNYIESDRVASDAFDLPLHISPELAGGFAELRVNHLHSGVDFKTLKRVGLPIYAPADGWVSRIRISSFGFGYALYLDHANGFTTVYGHLQTYAEPIATYASNLQYKQERFELDTLLPVRRIPVRKGQLIAYSGNSGISAAPHLHFEIRDSRTEETLDPLLWYSDRVKDNLAPKPQKVALYAIDGEGVLSTGQSKAIVPVFKNKRGEWTVGALPTAWGKIGLGLNAYDYMDNNSNQYGICSIRLFLNEELIFQQDLSRFNFEQVRYANSLMDYETMLRHHVWIMKSFVDPGNRLNVYPSLKDWGYVIINEQKKYSFRYELMDRAGNATVFNVVVQGQKRPIPRKSFTGKKMIFWVPNYFSNTDVKLEIPAGTLYNTLDFQFSQTKDTGYSDLFNIHNAFTPLHQPIQAKFRIQKDVLADKKHYYLAKVAINGVTSFVPSNYVNGWLEADLKEFGKYKVLSDTIMPKISAPNIESVGKNNVIRIRIADNASGIKDWRGSIDGKWALFSLDGKSGWLSCVLDSNRVVPGQNHELRLFVKDGCGNENHLSSTFSWGRSN
ncbi:MAG TPA: M23 family metallopeptidase [Bacteroidales bacterium]|nr:M23 family metallopeptidase [Bacteroidales bacterium]